MKIFVRLQYHTIGFGTANRMYTIINAFDPRGIIVIGFNETDIEKFQLQTN